MKAVGKLLIGISLPVFFALAGPILPECSAQLQKFKLLPDRDVAIIQLGGIPEIAAGLKAKAVKRRLRLLAAFQSLT